MSEKLYNAEVLKTFILSNGRLMGDSTGCKNAVY